MQGHKRSDFGHTMRGNHGGYRAGRRPERVEIPLKGGSLAGDCTCAEDSAGPIAAIERPMLDSLGQMGDGE